MADTGKGRTYAADDDRADAVHQLHAPAADSIDGALGPNFDAWTEHVQAHVQLPDADDDGAVEPVELAIPILQYGDGPNDYIATDVDAGQVIVRDGNDTTGRPWKYPLRSFYRFLAASQGKTLEGDDAEEAKGDGMYAAAVKQNERTNRLRAAEQEAADEATADGRQSTTSRNRAAAQRKMAAEDAQH